jgi:hypothetical protein
MWPWIVPLIVGVRILTVDLPLPVELGQDAAAVTLIGPNDADGLRRMSTIVADPAENLVLRLQGVEADQAPGVSWEVYVASSEETDCDNVPALVGILSFYGAPPGSEFVFPLDAAIAAGEPVGLKIIFKPTSGVEVDGVPVPPIVRTPARIGGITLETERATCQRSPNFPPPDHL